MAHEAVVTIPAGGVGGGFEDVSALAARGPTHTADVARPGLDHAAGVGDFFDQRPVPLAWARGAVEVVAIRAVAADDGTAAGVGDEGVMGGGDGAKGEGVIVGVGDGRAAGSGPRFRGLDSPGCLVGVTVLRDDCGTAERVWACNTLHTNTS